MAAGHVVCNSGLIPRNYSQPKRRLRDGRLCRMGHQGKAYDPFQSAGYELMNWLNSWRWTRCQAVIEGLEGQVGRPKAQLAWCLGQMNRESRLQERLQEHSNMWVCRPKVDGYSMPC
jgi:hypothetical protein